MPRLPPVTSTTLSWSSPNPRAGLDFPVVEDNSPGNDARCPIWASITVAIASNRGPANSSDKPNSTRNLFFIFDITRMAGSECP